MNSITKKCSKCQQEKVLSEFYKDRNAPSGLHIYCKDCTKKSVHKWHKENPERHYEIVKNWIKENPERVKDRTDKYRTENKEIIKEKAHKRYLKNQDKERKSARRWQLLNPERVKENLKRWFSENPNKYREYGNARRAKLAGKGKITSKEWEELCNRYDNKCLCCGRDNVKLTLDHVVPLKLGGVNRIENAQPLCGSCNSRKGAKHIDYRK